MAVNVPLKCMDVFRRQQGAAEHSGVHVWGAHGDVSFLRSSQYCHFNSSAVQGGRIVSLFFFFLLGLGTFAPTAAAAVD